MQSTTTNDPSASEIILDLQTRLKRLERTLAGGVLLGLAGIAGAFALNQPSPPPVVAAIPATTPPTTPPDATFNGVICRALTVVDSNDTARVQIDTSSNGAARLVIRDSMRRDRLIAMVGQGDESAIEIRDAQQVGRVLVGALPDGSSGIDLVDKQGTPRINLLCDEDLGCSISLAEPSGDERLRHEVRGSGEPFSSWSDSDGVLRVVTMVSNALGGFIDVNDSEQVTRVRAFVDNDRISAVMVLDTDQQPRISMDTLSSGMSLIRWWDGLARLRMVGGTNGEELIHPLGDMLTVEQPNSGWEAPNGGQ